MNYEQTIKEIIGRTNTEIESHGVEIKETQTGIILPIFWYEDDEGEIRFDADSIIFETFMSKLN